MIEKVPMENGPFVVAFADVNSGANKIENWSFIDNEYI
jgi:hypothetical protein